MTSGNPSQDDNVPNVIADYIEGLTRYLIARYQVDAGVDLKNAALDYAVSVTSNRESNEHLEDDPPSGMNTRRAYAEIPIEEEDATGTDRIFEKTEEARERIRTKLETFPFCDKLRIEQLEAIVDAMESISVKAGDIVIKEGDQGDTFYIIDDGKFQVFANDETVHEFINTGCFGELALIFDTPRNATVKAVTDGMLWMIDRRTFRRKVVLTAKERDTLYENAITSIPLFNGLDMNTKMYLLNSVKQEIYNDGQCIIKQGDNAECMYFVEEGIVRIEIESKGQVRIVNEIKKGDYFGELALIDNKPRAASAFAVGKTRVGVMMANEFKEYMEPMLDILEENKKKYFEQVRKEFGD
ncbi:hypothetical protein ACOME3_009260 [Neoechinorhynchus agilis]